MLQKREKKVKTIEKNIIKNYPKEIKSSEDLKDIKGIGEGIREKIDEILETKTLQELNKKQKLSIMRDILKGLAYIHNRRPNNLIHRDIKPTNILLTNSTKIFFISFFLINISNVINIQKRK